MLAFRPQDRYLRVNDLRLHYRDWGNDALRPMLLLHGFLAHGAMWDPLARRFRNSHHVIALDQRGHGESQWSKEGAYTIRDHLLDIARFVEDLDLNDFIMVGHSMGGRNALLYAACFPGKVKGLVLVDSRPGNHPGGARALRLLLDRLPPEADSFKEIAQTVQAIYPRLSWKNSYHMVRHGYRRAPGGKLVPNHDPLLRRQSGRSRHAVEDLWPILGSIDCPTLVIRGRQSPYLPAEDWRRMCSLIPGAAGKEIPGATHLPAQENPRVFARVVSDFLNSIG